MKKLILSLIFLTSVIASFGQAGSQSLSGVFFRVQDTVTYQAQAATKHSNGYRDIYFNDQATTKHFDVWNGSSYDHVFDFNGGGGGGSGTVESVTGDGVDNTDPDNPVLTFPVASEVVNTPSGGIAATNVQTALNELDTDKQAALVSGTNIKTVGGTSLLGSGNLTEVTQTITNGVTTTSPSEDAVFDALALKAPLASPTFTGTPAAPTASPGTNTTQLATTAFVTAAALPAATSSNDGYLTSTDWSTFNNKQISLTQNVSNTLSMGGTWTATGNNQYHFDRSGTFTARGTASDNLIGYKDTPSLIAAAASQRLISNLQTPTFNTNGQSNPIFVGNRYSATITGSPNYHVSWLIENGAVVIGHTALTGGVTGIQVRAADNTSGQIMLLESLSGSARFSVQSNGLSTHVASYTTSVSSGTAFGYGGTVTGRGSNADTHYAIGNQHNFTAGANGQTFWAYGYTGAINDPAFTSTSMGGYIWNPSITNAPDNNYGFVSAPAASLSAFGLLTPLSTVDIDGSLGLDITSTSVDITLNSTHHTILVDASGAARTITLPAVAGVSRREYTIKKTDSSGNVVTVDGNASETIDGATTYSLPSQWKYVTIHTEGSAWYITANN